MVLRSSFVYDKEKYGSTLEELGRSAQYTVPVVVQRNRILRTRARFDTPWSCAFEADVDDGLIDESQLVEWLGIAGRQIGLGDWRPQTSGTHGRFTLKEIRGGCIPDLGLTRVAGCGDQWFSPEVVRNSPPFWDAPSGANSLLRSGRDGTVWSSRHGGAWYG